MRYLRILLVMLLVSLLCSCNTLEQQGNAQEEEVPRLIIAVEKTTETLQDLWMVTEQINEYIRPITSAEIEFVYIDSSVYARKLNYMFSADEQVDIIFSSTINYVNSLKSDNRIRSLDLLIDQYGQGIIEHIEQDELDIGRINGELYGITTNRNKGFIYGFQYRKDIAEKYGIDMSAIRKLEDLTPVFEKLKEGNPDMQPFVPASYVRSWDTLGTDYLSIGVLMNYGQSTEVVDLYKTEEYKQYVELMYEWNQAGYIMDTTVNYSNDHHYYLRSDNAFCRFDTNSPEMIERESRILGKPLGYIALSPTFTTTMDLTYSLWSVAADSEYPDEAMQFLDLLYSDPVVANLVINGVEGIHYEVVDDEKQIIRLPEGVTNESTGYSNYNGWKFGNQFITYIWEGNSPQIWEETKNYNKESLKSKAFGFLFDPAPVRERYYNCMNTITEYSAALERGYLDPAVYLPLLQNDLEEAGIEDVIREKQRQLDNWLQNTGYDGGGVDGFE